LAIPYRRRRFLEDQGTVSRRSRQKALYSRRWMDLPSHQERRGFTIKNYICTYTFTYVLSIDRAYS
jgi:hypothetical protein